MQTAMPHMVQKFGIMTQHIRMTYEKVAYVFEKFQPFSMIYLLKIIQFCQFMTSLLGSC